MEEQDASARPLRVWFWNPRMHAMALFGRALDRYWDRVRPQPAQLTFQLAAVNSRVLPSFRVGSSQLSGEQVRNLAPFVV